jgi:hypothetical protein
VCLEPVNFKKLCISSGKSAPFILASILFSQFLPISNFFPNLSKTQEVALLERELE